uniref:hypothetical protein n=1 Tax=uncultured Halomonas sp. TaxID=173971 RepID=UPI00263073AE|nr:hypothetical protein [uncultured Halomonas sp.]
MADRVLAPPQNAPLQSGSQRSEPVAATDRGPPATAFGLLADDAGFVARLGPSGWRLGADVLSGEEVGLEGLPQPLPGVHFDTAQWKSKQLRLRGSLSIPYLDETQFEVRVDDQGSARILGSVTKNLALPALGNPEITLAMGETGTLSGEVDVGDMTLVPEAFRRHVNSEASGSIRLADGRLSGEGTVRIAYPKLGDGDIRFGFSETGAFTASGTLRITPLFAEEVSGTIAADKAGNLSGNLTLAVGAMRSTLPGLSLTGGTLNLAYMNGAPSGGIEDFTAAYSGLGSVAIKQADVSARGFAGLGTFNLSIPGLEEASGEVRIRDGSVSGSVKLRAGDFPDGLPVQNPTITASLSETGRVGVEGSAKVDLGPAGTGDFTAAYSETGTFSFGGDVELTIPGLNPVTAHIGYSESQISGEMQVPVDTALLPGLDGTVTVRYAQNRWSGDTTLDFSADDGKLSGSITVSVAQTDAGALQLGGEGTVTAQLMPRLQGTLTARILPEGAVDVSGVIEVTEPLELFPEQRMERELFRHSQNIPLWAILVAVIRVRAGVRAGVGPGVFRNIRVEGSYTLGAAEGDPSFTVTGELYMPAFVEGYVAFGAGLGVDVVLGSLTGGIEGVGTAGLYGAVSVVPSLDYADGDWGIEGTATLAAGARLKLGLNAWAEIEALWVTVWEKEWNLAEVVMPVGPDLGLQAHMSYTFGQPEPPSLEMSSSDIDTERLIQDAMPKDGPAPSGAREALENKAEWQGQIREQRAAAVPQEQVARQDAAETPPSAPSRPQKPAGGPPSGQGATARGASGESRESDRAPAAAEQATRSPSVEEAAAPDSNIPAAVPEGSLPGSDQPRYPDRITLAMLDEPPAPMPRTPSQEKQDLEAAGRMVDLANAKASDTDVLDNDFLRIKKRFGLVSLGYEGDFQKGFKVVGKINPEFERTLSEPLVGTGVPGGLDSGHITNITFEHGQLGGSDVGLKMRAMPLGPDHPQGSGPTGQKTLMDQLPTDPKVYSDTDSRFVRGHLLNDHVGGPGVPMNLFPITAAANAKHEQSIESFVKDWVNNRKLWIEYVVEVKATPELQAGDDGLKSIDAVFDATAAALDTNLNRIGGLTKHVTIASTYRAAATVGKGESDDFDKARLASETRTLQAQRPEDQGLQPQRSTRVAPTRFPDFIARALRSAISPQGLGSRQAVGNRLKQYKGFADESERVLFEVYDRVGNQPDATVDFLATPSDKGILTRIINTWPDRNGKDGLGTWLAKG